MTTTTYRCENKYIFNDAKTDAVLFNDAIDAITDQLILDRVGDVKDVEIKHDCWIFEITNDEPVDIETLTDDIKDVMRDQDECDMAESLTTMKDWEEEGSDDFNCKECAIKKLKEENKKLKDIIRNHKCSVYHDELGYLYNEGEEPSSDEEE